MVGQVLGRVPAVGQVAVDVHAIVGLALRKVAQHGVGRPDAAQTLLEDVVHQVTIPSDRRTGRDHQPVLDLVGRELRMGLQHQRDHAGCNGGGYAGAAHAEQAGRLRVVRVLEGQLGRAPRIVWVIVHE